MAANNEPDCSHRSKEGETKSVRIFTVINTFVASILSFYKYKYKFINKSINN